MAVKIRLARGGAKKRPYYRIVIADSRCKRDGKFIEKIGVYDPLAKAELPQKVKVIVERAQHWLQIGAQPTERVSYFFKQLGIKP